MKAQNILLIFVLFGLVSGCSLSERIENPIYYRSAVVTNTSIILPEKLQASSTDNYYPIPEIKTNSVNTRVSLAPPGSNLKN